MYIDLEWLYPAFKKRSVNKTNPESKISGKHPSTRLYLTVLKWSVTCPVACSSYSVCASAQASIFMVFWPFSPKKIAKSERWPNKWSKVKTLEDKPRSGWPFFHKLCEKYYRKSCKYMRNNSTKQKGNNGMGISYQKKLESLEDKKAVHTSNRHGVWRICQLYTKGGPAGKLTW